MKQNDKSGFLNKAVSKASDIGKKTVELGKRAAGGIHNVAKSISDKNKQDAYEKRMKKYNPIFPKDYKSKKFKLPNMIEIVDDEVRRGIDVCEGAIGWLEKHGKIEVFHIYDEWIKDSALQFVPSAKCDEVYCVDPFDRTRFIRVDCIFGKAHEEKLAELEHIAYSLGAKNCSIELMESNSSSSCESARAKVAVSDEKRVSSEFEKRATNSSSRSGKTYAQFEGTSAPKAPVLKWFANDDNIKGLVEMRCSGNNTIKSKTLLLEGSSSATMSQKAAIDIDMAIKSISGKAKMDMESQAIRENKSKLVFEIEF